MLDHLARRVAAPPAVRDADERLSRSTLVGRGLALLASVALGGIAVERANAISLVCPYGSLPICLGQQSSAFRRNVDECNKLDASPVDKLNCYRSALKAWDYGRDVCKDKCPKPKPPPAKKPPPKPTKPKSPSPTPPPLPPNPYDRVAAMCANCKQVGGKCCYGGADPTRLCGCGNPGLPCSKYGCSG